MEEVEVEVETGHLVLSRRKNEAIVFQEAGITITVVRINPSSVRLSIRAPKSTRVMRAELLAVPETETTEQTANPAA